MNFSVKEKLMLWISGNKKKSFSSQEVGRKMISPQYLRNWHILRGEEDNAAAL